MVLHSDSITAVAVFQVGLCRELFVQACTREIWWICAINGITLSVVHTLGDQLTDTVDVLSGDHLGSVFMDKVHQLRGHGVWIIYISHVLCKLSLDL